MKLKSRFWADLTTIDFAALQARREIGDVVAVLPLAATEQHGPHLPASVDCSLLEGVIAACLPHLAPELPVLFLPTQPVGKSNEHARFPGTLTLSAETLMRVWMELGACVARVGVRKLLLFNSHGGQVSLMDIVARDLRERHDMIVYGSHWFTLPLPAGVAALFSADEQRFGIHAGDMETSMMLALRPEWVSMAQARNFDSTARQRAVAFPLLGDGRSAKLGWQTQDLNPLGAAGDATQATAEKGHAVVQAAGAALAQLLAEFSRLPLDTLADSAGRPA